MSKAPHIENFLGQINDQIGEFLTYHLVLEGLLEQMLARKLTGYSPKKIGKMTFAQKVDAAYKGGLLSKSVQDVCRKLNKMRNRFAHEFGFSVTLEEIHPIAHEAGKAGIEFTDDADKSLEWAKELNYTPSDLLNATFRNLFFDVAYDLGEEFFEGLIN